MKILICMKNFELIIANGTLQIFSTENYGENFSLN
jgi:hypothetical protein